MSVPPAGEDHVTAVFERYLKSKEGRIVSKLKLDPASGPVEAAINAFSQALVDTEGDTLRRDETSRIVNQAAPWLNQWPDTLFGQLLSEGVLTADVTWDPGSNQLVEVVRFTYQRLADYRIGATILDPLEGDAELLSSALANDKSLLKTLESAPAGWVEALSVQVPERFGVELLDATQWDLHAWTRRRWEMAFIRSIATRRSPSVTSRTRNLLNDIRRRSPDLWEPVLETVISVATSSQHLLNANALHSLLMGMTMTERDVNWSIPTYFAFNQGGALDRLINWVGGGPYAECPDEMIELAAITVTWTFTSPNRRMRDYATKALSKLVAGRLSLLPPANWTIRGDQRSVCS